MKNLFTLNMLKKLNLQHIKNILDFSSPDGKEVPKRG